MSKSSVTRTASDALLAKWSALEAGYRPVASNNLVYDMLLEGLAGAALEMEGTRQRRQSPLVNAGYAARIACMTYAVESFLSVHKTTSDSTDSTPPLQVVLLGCGLDILGLWALSHSPDTIKLFEVDVLDIVVAKKELLKSLEWLQVMSTDKEGEMLTVEGNISANGGDIINYILASCDLKDIGSVEKALTDVDRSIPTLILSELVLAYLGRLGTDDLLSWCSSKLCVTQGSVFLAYEALGASKNSSLVFRSVVDGYKYQYCMNFRERLERGVAHDGDRDDDESFHPLGDSPGTVKKRLSGCGFSWSQAGLAGTVAACVFDKDETAGGGRSFAPCDPFDEHAALALHLHSYVLLCAFPEQTNVELIRSMCPWSTISFFDMKPIVVQVDDGTEICIRPIEARDQQQVQDLFLGTYKELSEQVPAVKKMVKTARNTDLKFSPDDETRSAIGLRYQTWGGVFLVATEISTDDDASPSLVLGCIGIRLCDASEGNVRGGLQDTFEIHRLAVDEVARGRGIGTTLLKVAEEEFIRPELNGDAYRLVATTPSLMKEANPLYTSNGFILEKQEFHKTMTINTYVKNSSL